jgi:hypothetical protein
MSDENGDLRLAELLDHSFGAGPDRLPAPVDRLATGRQALRRRHRFAVTASTVAVLAVAGAVVAVSGGSGQQAAEPPQAPVATAPGSPSAILSPTGASQAGPSDLTKVLERLSRRAHRGQELVQDQSALVVVSAADVLLPGRGASIVAQRPVPVVGGSVSAGDRMAKVRRDGRTSFVLVRGHGADVDLMTVAAGWLPEPTFHGFVDYITSSAGAGDASP